MQSITISKDYFEKLQALERQKVEDGLKMDKIKKLISQIPYIQSMPANQRRRQICSIFDHKLSNQSKCHMKTDSKTRQQFTFDSSGDEANDPWWLKILLMLFGLHFSTWSLEILSPAILIPAFGITFIGKLINKFFQALKHIVDVVLTGVKDVLVWATTKVWGGVCYVGKKITEGAIWVCEKVKSLWNCIWN